MRLLKRLKTIEIYTCNQDGPVGPSFYRKKGDKHEKNDF